MKGNIMWMKRIMAMLLTLCMMLGSMSGYVPGWFAAFAEEAPVGEAEAAEPVAAGMGSAPAQDEPVVNQESAPAQDEPAVNQESAPTQDEPADKTESAPAQDEPSEKTESAPAQDEPAENTESAPEQDEPADKTESAPVQDESAEKTESAPVQDEPADKTESAPVQAEPAEKTESAPAQAEPADKTESAPAQDEPAVNQESAPAQDEPAENTEESPAQEEPSEEGKSAPVVETAPGQEGMPVEPAVVPGKETPADETPSDETPSDETPSNENPDAEAPNDETPSDETPDAEVPNDETPSDEVPSDETHSDETPSEEIPSDETPSNETASDVTPSDVTPSDETPSDETPDAEGPNHVTPAAEAPSDPDGAPAGEEAPAQEAAPADGSVEEPAAEAGSGLAEAPALLGVSMRPMESAVLLNRSAANSAEAAETDPASIDGDADSGAAAAGSSTPETLQEDAQAAAGEAVTAAEAPMLMMAVPAVPLAETPAVPLAETPAVPLSDASAPAQAGSVGDASPTKPMLQAMIDDALIAVSGTLTGRVQVVLKKNMTYEGDVKIQVGDRSVADDFELELSAEDAGEDGASGSGRTFVAGNITIYGIRVLMHSVMMAADKVITVQHRSDSTKEEYRKQGGDLTYIGTKNAANEASFVIGDKSSATIISTDDDDVFTVETRRGAKTVTVSTGDGVDTVNATLNGGKVDIRTGFGQDKANINIAGDLEELRVDTGDSIDELTIIDSGAAKPMKEAEVEEIDEVTGKKKKVRKQTGGIIVSAGAGDDVIRIDVRDSAGSMTVDTGAGGDVVTVNKGDHFTFQSVDYDDYITAGESPNAATTAVLTIAGADRSDRVTVDASTALAIKGLDVTGEGASVFLTGELAADEGKDPITWIDARDHSKGFRLHTQLGSETTKNDYTLDISLGGNNFTDNLLGKKRVELYASADANGTYTYDLANQDFTDYVLRTPVSGLRKIVFNRPPSVTGDGLLLSNVVLDADETMDANDTVTVHDLTASHMNVLIKGETINLNGTIEARNVRAESARGTQSIVKTLADYLAGDDSFGDMVTSLFSARDAAVVNVNAGANIAATQDVALVARVKHVGGLLTFLPADINAFNLKLADAKINIADGAKVTAGKGNAVAEARIQTSTGYRFDTEKMQETAVGSGMPLAVNVIVNEAVVNVAHGAEISAGADAVLEARSDVKSSTYANSSDFLPSPLDIAVTVIDNAARVDLYGRVTAGRKAQVSAAGTILDENVATGASAAGGLSGGYIAVNVVNQDVNAIIHDGATVTAGGDVRLFTQSMANVTTSAISSAMQPAEQQMSVENGLKNLSKALGKTAWTQMKGWFDNDQKKQKRIEKLLKSISGSDYSVKLIKTSSENDEKGSATVTTDTDSDGKVTASVIPQPKSGCQVKEVRYRYLKPGEDHYTWVTVTHNDSEPGTWSFTTPDADVEVVVTYVGAPDGKDADAPRQKKNDDQEQDDDDFIDIVGLFNDAQDVAGGNAEEDDELFRLDSSKFEDHTNYRLAFDDMTNGAVLTWLTGEDGQSLKKVYAGEKLLLVVNPAQETANTGEVVKYRLKEGSLTVSYTIVKDGKTVTKKDVVTPDAQGRYVYTVPEGLAENAKLSVSAEFEPSDDAAGKEASHSQVAGAVAVGVLNNDGHALIETGTKVTAGGIVDMFSIQMSRNRTTADGTPVTAGASRKKDEDKPTPIVKTGFGTGGAEFAVRVNSNVDGAVVGTIDRKTQQGASAYHPVFTLSDAAAASMDRILISFYSKLDTDLIMGHGTRRTVTITRVVDKDGVVSYAQEGGTLFDAFKVEKVDGREVITANLTGLAIQNGTIADISFIFRDAAGQEGSQEYLIPNPIQVSYNALKNKDKSEISMGTVAYDGNHSTIGKYYFRVEPNRDAGYTIDAWDLTDARKSNSNKAVLYASWTDASGKVQKVSLKRDDTCAENVWFFQPTGGNYSLPEGTVITVNAVFREDLRQVKTAGDFDAKKAHGSVSANKAEAKRGDEVELTLVADDGYVADKVQVSWFEPGSASWKTEEKAVDRVTGKVRFTVPETSDAVSSYIRITPVFAKKTVRISRSEDIAVSEKDGMAWPGAEITVTPSGDKVREGYKVTGVTLIYNGQQHVFADGDRITVPTELTSSSVEIRATLARKTVRIAESVRENGTLTPVSGYADAREKVYVKAEADEGYRAKSGTLKAEIFTGTASRQIVLKKDEKGYYFTMPSDVDANTVVTLVGEFEPGSDGLDNSVGAAVAVGVLNADNEAEIKGGTVSAAGGYSLIGLTLGGKAITEAKAGYSKAEMGLAGAFAVQVGSVSNRVGIRRDDNGSITLDKGAFFVLGKGKQEFKTVGDAKGKKAAAEAGDTGVGAGIAVAVNQLSVTGEIEDGVKLVQFTDADGNRKNPTVTGITMNVSEKHKDEVTARAGAAGGSAWVPVAAVDVYNTNVLTRLGRLDMSQLQAAIADKADLTDDEKLIRQGILPVAGKVKLKAADASAKVEYNHLVTADAAARGGATAIGGAFIVTWISDDSRAELNQSLSASKAVSITSSSDSALKAVATAAVSGGVEGKKDDQSGKGGADKQADKLLGGAGGIAGKFGKQDGAKIQNDAKGRQQAETAENTLTGAGAFVLNMQKNKSRAELLDGVDLITKEKLEVLAKNRTDATIKADASATKSDTGVGIGVAINIVNMENIARVGSGSIKAAELELAAEIAKAPAKMSSRTVQMNATSLRSAMQKEVAEAIKDLIPEKYTKLAGVDLAGVTAKFAGTFVSKLFEDLGLDKLISLSAGDSVDAGIVNAGEVIVARLKQFPMTLVAPLATVFSETLETGESMMNADWWKTTLEDALKTATAEYAGDAWQTVKNEIISKGAKAIGGSVMDMAAGKLSGKGWDASTLKEVLGETFTSAMSGFVDQLIDTTINKMGDRIPLLTQANVERVKELKKALKEKTMDQLRGDLWTDISRTFREQVYDYEKYLIKYADGDFVTNAKNELLACLKESTVAMTNELLDQLSGALDVRFEKEPKTDRHVITTQAISGAGAKMKSGAGSLAISVANLTTAAEIADSGKGVSVTGDGMLSVKAEELRRIRTHATAAVDARGEADNDEGAGDTEDSETGGGAAARDTVTYHDKLTVTTGVGGSARFETGNTENDVLVMLDPKEGYTLKEGDTIAFTFKTKDSEDEDHAEAFIQKRGNGFFIQPLDGIMDVNTSYRNADIDNLLIHIDVEFDEVLHTVVRPAAKDSAGVKKLDASALSVSVEGREAKDGGTSARVGELVKLTVDRSKNAGSRVKGVEVTYKDADGNQHTETLDTAVVRLSANSDEIVYGFAMPNCDIGSITVIYEDGEDDRQSDTESEDANGRSIGVGAAVAIAYGGSNVKAAIGRRDEGVTAGTVAVRASVEHAQENYATAGTDPFTGTDTDEDSEKDAGGDAAVSVFIVDNNVAAIIAKGTSVTTTAKKDADFNPSFVVNRESKGDEDEDDRVEVTSGAIVVQASESGATETKASAFATGSNTAVGASVAVNVAISNILAEVGGKLTASGAASVKADSASEDETWSIATAMGADVQRSLNKFADKAEATGEAANNLTTGKYFDKKAEDKKDREKSNDTSKRITDRLNDDRVKSKDGDDASENLNVSNNVLRSQGSRLEAGEDAGKASGEAGKSLNQEAGRDDVNPLQDENQTKKLQVAATVGVTVALHTAAVNVSGDIDAGGDVDLNAVNNGNFRTRSTAAAMTVEKAKGKTIAAAVGVSVNNNKAVVEVGGDISASGDVALSSDLTQNMDAPYVGLLAVQAIGGSVSGKGSEASVAGAAGILVSHATTTSHFTGKTLSGGAVSIAANDKSKLAVRAGGINVSKGANVGMGISAATIWSGNTVEATVADGATITADDFSLNAAKQAVTWDDYKFPLTVQDLFSDSSKLNDEERENVYTGLIDIHRKPGETSYTVDVNLDTYALMKAFDALNFLSAVNYYTEAIAGSVVTGSAGINKPNAFNGAGSFSIVRISNTVKAALGTGVTVDKREDSEGDVSIVADDATTARMLGGAVSGGKANKSAGVTVTFLSDEDEAIAEIGDGSSVTGAGDVTISAKGDTQAEAYNAAASVNTSEQASFTVGGGINVLLLKNEARTVIGSLASVEAGGRLDVTAGADMDLKLVSVGVAGARKAVAAGGTLAYIDDAAESSVSVGLNGTLKANDDVNISARTTDHLLSVLASASAALEQGKTSFAGAINLLQSRAKGKVTLAAGGAGNGVISEEGSVTITGETDSRAINVTASAAGSRGKAIGMSVNANLFRRESSVEIAGGEGYAVQAARDVLIQAYGNDTTVMAGLALAGSTGGNAVGGNLPLVSSQNTVRTAIGSGAVTAGGEAAVTSHLKDRTYVIAGSVALSNGSSAVGGTALMAFKKNDVKTDLGTGAVTATGTGASLAQRVAGSPAFRGLYVGATVDNTTVTGAAGVALAGQKGVTANAVVLSSGNDIGVDASRARLVSSSGTKVKKAYPVYYSRKRTENAGKNRISDDDVAKYVGDRRYYNSFNFYVMLPSGEFRQISSLDEVYYEEEVFTGSDVTVKAANDVYNAVFAGGLNFGKSMGVGASAVVLASNNVVTANAHDIDACGSVEVIADNHEKDLLLNVNAGGSGKTAVELGVTVADLGNRVNAVVASDVKSRTGSFALKANNTTDMINVAVALAGAGKTAASPVFVYTGFTGETNAVLAKGTVAARNGASITANSRKDIDQYTVGAAFSGKTALSGAVSIVSVKDQTNAQTLAGTSVGAETLNLESGSDYNLVGASAAVAASGATAAAVNGMVTVMKAATLAELGGDAATTRGAVRVDAHSSRDVVDVAATVAASGQNAAGITVMALVAGDALSQDAADQLTYGSGGKEGGAKAFDSSAIVNALEEIGVDTAFMKEKKDENGNVTRTGLADDLKGDGQNMDTHVGSNGGFDAASGYTASDVYSGGSGENARAEETRDVQNVKTIGATARDGDAQDFVTARIAKGASVNTAGGVSVEAKQETLADLFGASVAASGEMAGGLSLAIAQLRTGVVAASLGDIRANGRDVSVNAVSRSGSVSTAKDEDEASRNASLIKALGDKLNPSNRSIRAISVAAGAAGTAAAGIAAGAVRTDNVTNATLGGSITGAGKVTVNSDHKYRDVMAATVGLAGGGEAGIAASIAGVGAYGTVTSKLDGSARISGLNPDVAVTSDSVVNADTVGLAAAIGGGAGVAAGLSFVRNELTQHTSVDRGASIVNTGLGNGGSLTVAGKSSTTGSGLLMGLSGGTVGVGIAVGIVNVDPTLNTSLGVNGTGTAQLERLGDVKVLNDASSSAAASVLSVSAGAGAIGANVLTVFNDTNATASAANVSGSMDRFAIDGQLDASGSSDVMAVAAGGGAVGVNVNYVDVNSTNTALLDAANFTPTIAGQLSVTVGDAAGNRTTSATTQSNTGTAGAIAVGVNVSIARNRALNDAVITGGDLNAANVVLGSYGKGTAKADMSGVSAGGIKITASVVDALNETTNRARMNLTGRLNGSLEAESRVEGETTAKLTTGGGSIVGIDTNVATAYGRTNAVTDVAISGASADGSTISVKASGKDTVTADIDNLVGLNAISVATMVGAAHAQDVYSAKARLNYGDYRLSRISVNTESDINAKSTVTPSSCGVNLAGASVGVNVSTATSTAYAGSELVLEGASLAVEKDVDVKTTTSSKAEAIVKPAVFSVGFAIDVGVNKVKSDLKSTQAATLRMNRARITGADVVNVRSLVSAADSRATVSTSGADEDNKDRVKLGTIAVDYNTAEARESLASTAAIIGGAGSHLEEYQEADGGEWALKPIGMVKKVKAGVNYNPSGKTPAERYQTIYDEVPLYKKVWVPNMVTRTRLVRDDLKAEDNRITANRLYVGAGPANANVSTGARAYTQGAFQVGLLTVGNLDGQAYTGESINAVFSGATADIAGAAQIIAQGNTVAAGTGTMPGALSLVNKGASDMKAGVGTQSARQTVKALIGEGAALNAGRIDIDAANTGNAVASVNRGVAVAIESVGKSSQPTESWYDTGVVIGDGVRLTATANQAIADATGNLNILSKAWHNATSSVSGTSVGIGLNLNTMMGQNTIYDENNIDIGKRAVIRTVLPEGYDRLQRANVLINAETSTIASATTDMTGGGFIEGTSVKASNSVTRNARINIGEYATIQSAGDLRLHLTNGAADWISTVARVETDGALALGDAEAVTTLNSSTEIHVGEGSRITGYGDVRLQAKGGSVGRDDKSGGIETTAVVKAHGGGINPVAISKTVLNVTNYVDVNRRSSGARPAVTIRSETGTVNLWATNDYTHVITNANADGKAAGGRSLAKAITFLNLVNTVWVDDANLEAPKGKVLLEADNGDKYRALIEAHPYGELYAIGGIVSSDLEWGGVSINQIRTNDKNSVHTLGKFIHEIVNPISIIRGKGIRFSLTQDISRAFFTTVNGSMVYGRAGSVYRCDFCGVSGHEGTILTGEMLNRRPDARTNTGNPFEKALAPIGEIQRMVDNVLGITKARYGEEDYVAAGRIFVLEFPVMLKKDVTLGNEQILRYRLWNNARTMQDVFMLPNATRLYGSALSDRIRLNYVSEVIRGDVRGDGGSHLIDIITALTPYALRSPVIPIGSTGSLDFSTGVLTLPSGADFELYLHEVSGQWLLEKLREGLIRRLSADQDAVNRAALRGRELPNGVITESVVDGGTMNGWPLYWLGDTPDTATDADEVLIGLLVNPDTDEIDAFRTSVNMIEGGEEPVDVSLYLYRDSKSDRMEEEKYNCMFFDTPEGEKSLVKVVTDVLMNRELEMPRSMKIVLRGFEIAGADFPVYSLTDHFFALCDGTDGGASLFDGFYTNTFDGDTFDSDYIRIEGIVDGDLNVTVKAGQPIWPEWTGENTAEDIAGNPYTRVDNVWYNAEEAPLPESAAAA